MNNPRYLLAKFIPDLSRMEPRNIGVIVWSKNGTAARFLAEKPATREIDGRSIPGFITNVTNQQSYKQWVGFWRSELKGSVIEPVYGGPSVSVQDSRFIDVLKESGRGHFILEEGGFLLDELPLGADAGELADYLFSSLIDETVTEDTKDPTLQQLTDQVLAKSTMRSTRGFSSDYLVECNLGKATDTLKFNHAFQNGHLSLFQKVSLPRRSSVLEKNVHSTAWMFEQVVKANIIDSRERGFALVYVPPEQMQEPAVDNAIKILDSVASVYNLYNQEEELVSKLKTLAEHACTE